MGGYQGLMNTFEVHAAGLRQGISWHTLTINPRVLHTPHQTLYPSDGSERGDDGRWRVTSLKAHAASLPGLAICSAGMGNKADRPMIRNIKTRAP